MATSLRIFLSSTHRELATERLLALEALEMVRQEFPGLEYFAPRSQAPMEACLEEANLCDEAIFILGHCYGAPAPGKSLSQAEIEFLAIREAGKPIHGFLLDPSMPVLPSLRERDPNRLQRLSAFRNALNGLPGSRLYTDPPQLASLLRELLRARCLEAGLDRRPLGRSAKEFAEPETRRAPVIPSSSLPDDGGPATRTLPSLQQALSQPFKARSRHPFRAGSWTLGLLVLAASGAFFWVARGRDWLAPANSASNASLDGAGSAASDSAQAHPSLSEQLPPPDTLVVTQLDDPELAHVEAARNGDREARLKLGMQYRIGEGLPRNDSAAFHWVKLAANQGLAEAQYRLGTFYADGIGTTVSRSKAAFWFEKAAEQGHIRSQAHLGEVYLKGLGYFRDEGKGFRYLLKASAAGDSLAQAILLRQGQKAQ